jgi:hypothetical protein
MQGRVTTTKIHRQDGGYSLLRSNLVKQARNLNSSGTCNLAKEYRISGVSRRTDTAK